MPVVEKKKKEKTAGFGGFSPISSGKNVHALLKSVGRGFLYNVFLSCVLVLVSVVA